MKSVFLKRQHIQLGPRSTRSEGIPAIPVESSVMEGVGSSDTKARDRSNLRWIEIVYIYIYWLTCRSLGVGKKTDTTLINLYKIFWFDFVLNFGLWQLSPPFLILWPIPPSHYANGQMEVHTVDDWNPAPLELYHVIYQPFCQMCPLKKWIVFFNHHLQGALISKDGLINQPPRCQEETWRKSSAAVATGTLGQATVPSLAEPSPVGWIRWFRWCVINSCTTFLDSCPGLHF